MTSPLDTVPVLNNRDSATPGWKLPTKLAAYEKTSRPLLPCPFVPITTAAPLTIDSQFAISAAAPASPPWYRARPFHQLINSSYGKMSDQLGTVPSSSSWLSCVFVPEMNCTRSLMDVILPWLQRKIVCIISSGRKTACRTGVFLVPCRPRSTPQPAGPLLSWGEGRPAQNIQGRWR